MALILIVDDSLFQRKTVTSMIEKEGHEVIQAKGGLEGIELAMEKKPDLIVLDLLMPKFDGFEVMKTLNKKSMNIPVLIISADIQDTTHEMCKELGAAGFINKPVNRDELVSAINSITGIR